MQTSERRRRGNWRRGQYWSAPKVAGRYQSKTRDVNVFVGCHSCAQNATGYGKGTDIDGKGTEREGQERGPCGRTATSVVAVTRRSGSPRSESVSLIDCINVSYIIVDARLRRVKPLGWRKYAYNVKRVNRPDITYYNGRTSPAQNETFQGPNLFPKFLLLRSSQS